MLKTSELRSILGVHRWASESGELLVVLTNADAKNAVPIYLRRWEIECLFQSLKGRGFRSAFGNMFDDSLDGYVWIFSTAIHVKKFQLPLGFHTLTSTPLHHTTT